MKTSTIGQALRSEQQSRHISLERLAEQIHVKLSYLEALENDDFSPLPTAAYVRGYIRAYAQQLGVEPRPLLALLRRDYKETNKGVLVPREFIKSVRPRRLTWTPVTWIAISLMLFWCGCFVLTHPVDSIHSPTRVGDHHARIPRCCQCRDRSCRVY